MNRVQYNHQINDLQGDLKQVECTLSALQTTNPDRYSENMEALSLDAAYQMEALTCRMRHIIYRNTEISKPEYLSGAIAATGLVLQYSDRTVSVILPELIPNRKRIAGHEFIAGPLFQALAEAAQRNALPKFTTCTLCIVHSFAPGWRDRITPDYDNLELKAIQDLLAAFCLVDDSMKYCNRYETTRTDTFSHTEFHIIRQEDFFSLLEQENGSKAAKKDMEKGTVKSSSYGA